MLRKYNYFKYLFKTLNYLFYTSHSHLPKWCVQLNLQFDFFLKELRHEEFVKLKKHIILCMDDLDQVPETSFEKDVVCEDEESFCLSKENIDSLKVLLHQVQHNMLKYCNLKL